MTQKKKVEPVSEEEQVKKFAQLAGIKAAKKMAQKNWGKIKPPVWNLILKIALEKKLTPAKLTKLIKSSKHPADVFVKK